MRISILCSKLCHILVPVTICSLYTCLIIRILEANTTNVTSIMERTWNRLGVHTGKESFELSNFIVVIVFLALVAFMTVLMLLIFYLELHSCLGYYFYLPSIVIMALITPAYARQVFVSFNLTVDLITIVIVTWNFAAFGIMSIFGLYATTPFVAQQFYLIHNSSVLSVLMINVLPGWAPWLLLGVLVLWDLFAVLAPIGPLNLIIDMAERNGVVEMPGLIYSTDPPKRPDEEEKRNDQVSTKQTKQSREEGPQESDNKDLARSSHEASASDPGDSRMSISLEEKGVNIGLGDFIFYGLLVGSAAKGRDMADFHAVLATLLAILVGLIITLFLLALSQRALPALPISIGLGLVVHALTWPYATPFANQLASASIFV